VIPEVEDLALGLIFILKKKDKKKKFQPMVVKGLKECLFLIHSKAPLGHPSSVRNSEPNL
jgi:hypothetical protein